MMAFNLIITAPQLLQARDVAPEQNKDNSCKSKNYQQTFIGRNGEIGIYQPNLNKAYVGNDSYTKVKAVLLSGPKKLRKPFNSVSLGKLVDGEDVYELYGRNNNPAPVNDGPDYGVRTEDKLSEDFMRDFGSGAYTPDDKWD